MEKHTFYDLTCWSERELIEEILNLQNELETLKEQKESHTIFDTLKQNDFINFDLVCKYQENGKTKTKLINKTHMIKTKTSEFIVLIESGFTHSKFSKDFVNNQENINNIIVID